MKSASVGSSKHSVLPPIIPETEKEFLESIQSYIISEIEKVGCTEQGPAEDYYIIYRNVFEMIIEHVNAYKSILTTIKQEYDAFIEVIKKGQHDAFYLHGKLKTLACESSTLMYYKKRITQLEEKVKRIEKNSARTESLIQKLKSLRLTLLEKEDLSPVKKVNPAKKIPGLNMKDSLDIDVLSNHLDHLQKRLKELKDDMLTKYIPIENTANVEGDMNHALQKRNMAEKNNESLKFCFYRLTLFASVITVWENTDRNIDTLQLLIHQMIENEKFAKGSIASSVSSVFERDPAKSKEAEDLIEFIERLEFSEAAGDAIFKYADVDTHNRSQCLALAQIAYSECGAHKKAVLCLCKQGQIYGAMDYLHHFKLLSAEDYIFLLKHCPRIDFIHCLTQEWNGKPPILSLGETILSLIGTEHEIHGIHLLEDITKKGKDTLEQIIVKDISNVEGWKEIAETCLLVKKEHLYKLIISALASLEGVFEIPADDTEDAKLMEHVFL
ncbi:clathrin heavy chain linker domain-containing protein 1 isoform X5 [Ahaetulla prasina]|uniref:clathrin heavy chain linker domain-containing protein 1 isoform X5 n=1 Tax=Ahaetulla prasina TaxID=499056 RepID=UPI00264736D7|nr:clathrin heavy chain linker domain-containing protein 1 isoform X5 [Ahaetulla prasina]